MCIRDRPGGGGVEAGEDVHHRGLAGAGGAHDGREFTGAEADAHVVEGAHLCVATSVDLGDALESDDGRGLGRCGRGGLRDCRVRVHVSIVRLRCASPLRRFPLIHPRDHPGYPRGRTLGLSPGHRPLRFRLCACGAWLQHPRVKEQTPTRNFARNSIV